MKINFIFFQNRNVAPYDIALLKLKKPLVFNEFVQPIAVPKPESIPEGESTLSGWGSTSSSSSVPVMPNSLQKVELPVVDHDTCKSAIDALNMGENPLHETNVCTGPLTGGISACSVSFLKILFYSVQVFTG